MTPRRHDLPWLLIQLVIAVCWTVASGGVAVWAGRHNYPVVWVTNAVSVTIGAGAVGLLAARAVWAWRQR